MEQRIHSFDPVATADAKLLILGTMASVESLRQGFYYAHPRNCFWPMLAQLLDEATPDSIEAKKALLTRHKIALWDVARSCLRPGSLDSAMREIELNDIPGFLDEHLDIRRVLLNGGTAWRLYQKLGFPDGRGVEALRMPSTSPAYTLAYEKKKILWAEALRGVAR